MNARTAISVPQDVLKLSERLAKKLKLSRSAVFARAVKRLGEEYDEQEFIARVNAVCAEVDTSVDPLMKTYQRERLRKNE
jgi:metal-responsive CopG/Arc/MetJ family transcriptional regulator